MQGDSVPIKVDWYKEDWNIIGWVFDSTWTVEEYRDAAALTTAMTQDTPAYYIITWGAERTPPDITTASLGVHRRARPNYRFSVNILPGDYVKMLGQMIGDLPPARSKIFFAGSEAEALQLIEKDRAERKAGGNAPGNSAET
jgi:hypothetical protein